jgi:hypothetical protein
MILSLGLLADDASQVCTLAKLNVWVTPGLLASTFKSLAAPGGDSGARRTGFLGEREKRSGVKTNRIPG